MNDRQENASESAASETSHSKQKNEARERLLPKSKIRKAHLKAHGIPFTLKRLRELIDAGVVKPSDYTHCGKLQFGVNIVELYDLAEIARDASEHSVRHAVSSDSLTTQGRAVYGYF